MNKIKSQPTGWKKIFANDVTEKDLTQVLIQLNIIKTNNPIKKKMGRRIIVTFFQRRYSDGQKAHEKCSTLLIIREMQIKITMRDHLTQVKIDIFKKSTNNKCW